VVDRTRAIEGAMSPEHDLVHPGEWLAVQERVVVAPCVGRFRASCDPRPDLQLRCGDEIGVLEGPQRAVVVRSPFSGELAGLLAADGQRVRAGEPLAWLRTP
jgi:biotin carboxyl carrier protein